MTESGRMEQDRGGVNDFHEICEEFNMLSLINIDDQREGDKDTDNGKEYWGRRGSFIMGLYGETYLTSVDGTVY